MDYKAFVIESGKRMLRSGLTVGTWGNVSARDPQTGLIYLTPSGMLYETLVPNDIIVMNDRMETVEGTRKPTIEYAMHVGIMQRRPDVNAVIHTHPLYSQVFACLRQDIPPVIDEAAQILGGAVRCAQYALPGTEALAENVIQALGDGAAALMANHGAVCVGGDMDAAFLASTVLEMTAQIYQMALAVGKPAVIEEDKVRFMKDFVANRYGQR